MEKKIFLEKMVKTAIPALALAYLIINFSFAIGLKKTKARKAATDGVAILETKSAGTPVGTNGGCIGSCAGCNGCF